MAWTAPMTAVANTIFTAAQFNTHVRDNLNETAPAKATTEGQLFVARGVNSIAARRPAVGIVSTTETTASATYTDLATPGPAITLTTGTRVLVFIQARMSNSAASGATLASVAVSGATTLAASDDIGIEVDGIDTTGRIRSGAAHLFNTLTTGSNSFTMQYRAGSGTAQFSDREIIVFPLS